MVQPKAGCTLTQEDVQEGCKSFIASYKKPRYVVFCDDIGRNDAGKVRLDRMVEYFHQQRGSC